METKANPLTVMLRHPSRNRTLVFASLLALLAVGSCKSSPTAPGGSRGSAGTAFNLGPFAVGQSAKLTFPTEGTFGYHCIAHRSMGMVGTVQVDASGTDSTVVQIGVSGFAFTPPTAHVKPGSYVRWVNASSLTNHTVTSD